MEFTESPLSWMGGREPLAVCSTRCEDGTRETLWVYHARREDNRMED